MYPNRPLREQINLFFMMDFVTCVNALETHTLLTRIRLVLWHRLARALRARPRPSLSLSPLPVSRARIRAT